MNGKKRLLFSAQPGSVSFIIAANNNDAGPNSMLRKVTSLLACLSLALTLTGCGNAEQSSAPASTPEDTPDKPRVALIMKSLANEFFINMAAGAEQHQAQNDSYELVVNGIKNESDLAQQVSLVEQMMATQVDIIVIAPADSKGLLPVVKRAIDRGIVVVNIDIFIIVSIVYVDLSILMIISFKLSYRFSLRLCPLLLVARNLPV